MILYINNEHCSSVEQLKGYFKLDNTPGSDIYADLLDYGRYGDIAAWLLEMGEAEMAVKVNDIPSELGDSAFYTQLKAAILGTELKETISLKPAFDKCFVLKDVKCDMNDNESKVSVMLKVLLSVNEKYELSVSSNWGTRAEIVNPYHYTEGKTATIEFTLRKRPGKEIGEIVVKAEGKELSSKKIQKSGRDAEITVGDVKFKMMHVDGGTFTMGATSEMKDPYENEKPTHQVTLSPYYIGETPVTQALWTVVMGSNPSYFQGDQRPVESVSWNDCQEFIKKLNGKTGKNFRLLTEAEWEYAARGGNKSKHTQYSGSDNLGDVAWFDDNSAGETHPVKQKKPNELGIYDMSGNVWEWCQDWYGNYKNGSQTNLTGPSSGSCRVDRGGSWNFGAGCCRLSYRGCFSPYGSGYDLGLRLALSEL